jgi:hypothetical protein
MDYTELLSLLAIGFVAQIVDSAIGMAFGTLSSALLLSIGFPPTLISPTIHTAEIFSGGASAYAHYRLKNIDVALIKKLALPAVIGAGLGAFLMLQFDAAILKIIMSCYFVIAGMLILIKTLGRENIIFIKIKREILGFGGGFLDAFVGAGWGEFVSTGLILRNFDIKKTVGSLNCVEFLITLTASTFFFISAVTIDWYAVLYLAIGGIMGAFIGARLCQYMPIKPLTLAVGFVIMILGLKNFWQF